MFYLIGILASLITALTCFAIRATDSTFVWDARICPWEVLKDFGVALIACGWFYNIGKALL